MDIADPTYLEFPYLRHVAVALHCVAGPETPLAAVHIGGAGCTMPRYLAATRPGSEQLVVDADDELMDWVRAEFDIDDVPGLTVRIGDGREHLDSRPDSSADLVMVDAYEQGSCVGDLVTVEATRKAASLLRPGGIQVVNVIDGPGLPFTRRVVATMASVYETVLLLAQPNLLIGTTNANLVLVCGTALPTGAIARLAAITMPRALCVAGDTLAAFRATAQPLTDSSLVNGPMFSYATVACG